MLYNDAEIVQARLDDRWPEFATTLTRLAKVPQADNQYRVSITLPSPLGPDELQSLIGMATGEEFSARPELTLEDSGSVAVSGAAFTAVYE